MATAYEDWYTDNEEYQRTDETYTQLIDETDEEYRERIASQNPYYY